MSGSAANDRPADYELRIDRHIDDRWAEWLGDLSLTREPDGTTTLRGRIADQAALHGILNRIRDLGLVLLSVQAVRGPDHGG